ncbi:MAG: hypothetical protein A2806_00015 [Candidatus Terrybacteria bacterium RIFCSPHIGHO2_01_FULL_48_17]|uniref:Uncharacterized protein n=1 Tax=Candidatus Terrybacteria bacterium RIFCSPHIGHO2_01_FULL_48_17 TaxID=1802362 RepID=A0A1G2PJN6_9BACT|nr:MAG: hypothetical protein A2806_00015 [Candidatus Terrybacteria bacterium RIFCSPHIGHO2_01_FULL_48_17]OHA52986.1 MAG: hypothetical protein A3A30_01645 [Candidatus Terrybacteria bacterium RIFCSPLOWO2_01_FULL_48_14]
MKRSVVLCGSQQKKEGLYKFYDDLTALGIAALKPDFEGRDPRLHLLEESERIKDPIYRQHLESFVRAHLERIRGADVCFIYNQDGKFGVNTRLEFDYARRLGKPIFSLLPLPAYQQEYVEAVVEEPKHLLPWLGEYIAILSAPHRVNEVSEWQEALRIKGLVPLAIYDTSPRSLHRLSTADVFYVYNPESKLHEDLVALLGGAVAHGRPVYAYDEDPVEVCCNSFFHPRRVRKPDDLFALLHLNGNGTV